MSAGTPWPSSAWGPWVATCTASTSTQTSISSLSSTTTRRRYLNSVDWLQAAAAVAFSFPNTADGVELSAEDGVTRQDLFARERGALVEIAQRGG